MKHNKNFKSKTIKYLGIFITGLLGLLHALSHIIPAAANIGYIVSEQTQEENEHSPLEEIMHHPLMNIASIFFVILGFYYIYKDHKHHKHEHILKKKIMVLESELKKYKKPY
ncbi:MAG TPA: hypothetical protein VEC16_00060 [Alphaproteobacteria bacterium]|nr:hypothetical protein [Alphaproteobacteria bacterium]